MLDRAGRAADIADNALRADHSRDRSGANIPNTVATADNAGTANIAGSEHPRSERSMGHIPGLEDPGRPGRTDQISQPPRKTLSSDRPPRKGQDFGTEKLESKRQAVKREKVC